MGGVFVADLDAQRTTRDDRKNCTCPYIPSGTWSPPGNEIIHYVGCPLRQNESVATATLADESLFQLAWKEMRASVPPKVRRQMDEIWERLVREKAAS